MDPARPRSPLARLFRYAAPFRRRIAFGVLTSVLNKVFDLAPPLLIGLAVDVVVEKEASFLASIGINGLEPQLWVLAALTFIIWGLESAFEYAEKIIWRNLAQDLQHTLRLDAWAHVLGLDMAWFSDHNAGELLAVLNDDVNQLERFLDGGANDLIQVSTTVVVVSGVFFFVHPGIAALALLPIPLILLGSFRFQSLIAPRYATVRRAAGHLAGQLTNHLGGIEVLKAYAREDAAVADISALSAGYREANRSAISLSSSFSPLIRMVIVVGFTATLVYGGMLAGRGVIEVGSYSVLVFLTQRLLWPLTALGATVDLYFRAMASAARILDLLDVPVGLASGPEHLSDPRPDLAFESVSFAYSGRQPVLHEVSLRVPFGQTVAFVGPTGAGKSTLVRLLLRLHDPTEGRLTLGGHDLRALDLPSARHAVGWVSQQVYLFEGTVGDNLRLAKPDATDAELHEALASAEARDFVLALPHGLDTQVGERGHRLSGGQAQRLSLARALLRQPPILVLDEATSAVDNETEAAIQRSLLRVAQDRTVLVVAHRLSTIVRADRIFVLDAGRIVQAGTHAELLAQPGAYARLWAVQTGLTA